MNVSSILTMDYENISDWTLGENKPNSNPMSKQFQSPICPGCLFTNRLRRKQSKKDFLVFLEKLPVMILTCGGK